MALGDTDLNSCVPSAPRTLPRHLRTQPPLFPSKLNTLLQGGGGGYPVVHWPDFVPSMIKGFFKFFLLFIFFYSVNANVVHVNVFKFRNRPNTHINAMIHSWSRENFRNPKKIAHTYTRANIFTSMKFIQSKTRLQLNVMLLSITNSTLKEW